MTKLIDNTAGYENNAFIHTTEGPFYMANPTWNIKAMGHALAQNARYNGNAREFYSVAEHSVLVSLMMEEMQLGDPMEGLLHDGTESILSDVPAPWKHLLPDWRAIDKRLDTDLRKKFDLPADKTEGCQTADWLALFIEAKTLIPGEGADFVDSNGLRPRAMRLMQDGWHINCFPWKRARSLFLRRYDELARRR